MEGWRWKGIDERRKHIGKKEGKGEPGEIGNEDEALKKRKNRRPNMFKTVFQSIRRWGEIMRGIEENNTNLDKDTNDQENLYKTDEHERGDTRGGRAYVIEHPNLEHCHSYEIFKKKLQL